jgi:hypothetical protein
MPGSSQSGAIVGLMLSVQVDKISTPRTASRALSTGVTSRLSSFDISAA